MQDRAANAANDPPRRALGQALRSVPAGGLILELAGDSASVGEHLEEHRRDAVVTVSPGPAPPGRGLLAVRAEAAELPFPDRAFLASLSLGGLPACSTESDARALAATLCRYAARYVVVASLHRLALRDRGRPGARRRHRAVEELFGAHGFRPHARAAEAAFSDPRWVYVFHRA